MASPRLTVRHHDPNFVDGVQSERWDHENLRFTWLAGAPARLAFVAGVSPLRTRRLSPPFGGGARGGEQRVQQRHGVRTEGARRGIGSRLGDRVGPLGPCKIRLRPVSNHTAKGTVHPPWPPPRSPPLAPPPKGGEKQRSVARADVRSRATKSRVSKPALQYGQHHLFATPAPPYRTVKPT